MSSIVFEIRGQKFGGKLTGRVLIGRKLSHGVVSDDPEVSRLHAWIDPVPESPGRWTITDAGSKSGTRVDGRAVSRHELKPGNVIAAGPLRIRFDSLETLPDDVKLVPLTPTQGTVQTPGILFDCVCGAPIWAGENLAGKRGMCRHCRRAIVVPQPGPVRTEPSVADSPVPKRRTAPARLPRCGVCHAEIHPAEPTTACADCDIRYHQECWEENGGCSTYGCPQVNALLAPPTTAAAAPGTFVEPEFQPEFPPVLGGSEPPPRASMIPLAMFLSSLLAFLVGAIAFGVPSLLVAAASAFFWTRDRRPLLVVALAIGLIGFAGGLAVSDWWYLNSRHLQMFGR